MTPEDLDRIEGILIDLVGIGAKFAPPPYNAMLSVALPLLESLVRHQVAQVRVGLADGSLLLDGKGGFISKEWADDPRHALNPDGTFKF